MADGGAGAPVGAGEGALLASAIADRVAYEMLRPVLNDRTLSQYIAFWWKALDSYYRRDPSAKYADKEVLGTFVEGAKRASQKQRAMLSKTLGDLPLPVSPQNVAAAALEHLRRRAGFDLAAAIGAGDRSRETTALAAYNKLFSAVSLAEVGSAVNLERFTNAAPIDALFSVAGIGNKIPLSPPAINSRLDGGASLGQHIIAFTRPDGGKTSFAINTAATLGPLAESPRLALYLGNEEHINLTKMRAVTRVTGMTVQEIAADEDRARALYVERKGEACLRFIQLHHASADDLRSLLDEHRPAVVVLDQIHNLAATSDMEVRALTENGQRFRELLAEYNALGLSLTQAGREALYLRMEDLYGSKTGLQGTADLIIGIGFNDEYKQNNQRMLTFPKNKMSSGPDKDMPLTVDVDFATSTWT